MSSEGSCDTEDWSNDAENSVLRHRNKLLLKKILNKKHLFYFWNNTSQYYGFNCIFDQINAALVSIKELYIYIKKKNLTNHQLLNTFIHTIFITSY